MRAITLHIDLILFVLPLDQDLLRGIGFITQDGGGVSNNPSINLFNLGKPSYDKAAVQVNGVRSISITMRYM